MPFGTELMPDGRVKFRLWAPAAGSMDLCLVAGQSDHLLPMTRQAEGWYEIVTAEAGIGSLYFYLVDKWQRVPDPASRFQPRDVHGPSQVMDPCQWNWQDNDWQGRPWNETVIYELHVGSFTRAGNFEGVESRLDYLLDLGVTAIELMPIADFPGQRNWGYDGVLPFAPDHTYGEPDALKSLIEAAHARGIMVLLDVVYNHFGPEGNYLHVYAPDFFTDNYVTPWGQAINFDGKQSHIVREYFIHNALYWLDEFHLDGLRLDAAHAIHDSSTPDILDELAIKIRTGPGTRRHVHLVLENDNNEARYLRRSASGPQVYDAQWNDDLHHAMHSLLTGEEHGYYSDYAGHPAGHLCRALTEGYVYQGEPSSFRGGRSRGTLSKDLPAVSFVGFLQNHDQIGNRAAGERISMLAADPAIDAMTALLVLAPSIPLLFMGQEWSSKRPFPYFCDYEGELGENIRCGRRGEFKHFPGFAAEDAIPDPLSEATFVSSWLDWESLHYPQQRQQLEYTRRLLQLRQLHIVPILDQLIPGHNRYEVHGDRTFTVVWPLQNSGQLVLYANLQDTEQSVAVDLNPPLLFTTHIGHIFSAGNLPPWFVAWSLS